MKGVAVGPAVPVSAWAMEISPSGVSDNAANKGSLFKNLLVLMPTAIPPLVLLREKYYP